MKLFTPEQRRIEFDGYRFYNCAENIETDEPIILGGTTTILSQTKDHKSRKYLDQWKIKNADKSLMYTSDGTLVHKIYEYHNAKRFNLPFDDYENIPKLSEMTARQIRLVKNYKPLNDRVTALKTQEAFTYYIDKETGIGWAGTSDGRGSIRIEINVPGIRGIRSIIIDDAILDTKTSENPKIDKYVFDYKLQILSYILAENQRTNSNIKDGVILITVNSDEIHNQYFHVNKDELNRIYPAFITRVNQFYSDNGKPLRRAKELALQLQNSQVA